MFHAKQTPPMDDALKDELLIRQMV